MAKVSVSEEVIASMLEIMQKARCTLESDVVELRRIYYQAGVDWNDKKYRELGDVIERSCRNILIIGCDLGESKEKLKNLQKNIIEYITSGNASNSNNAAVYARNIESTPWSTISGEHNITVPTIFYPQKDLLAKIFAEEEAQRSEVAVCGSERLRA